jgi:hypothetical protein
MEVARLNEEMAKLQVMLASADRTREDVEQKLADAQEETESYKTYQAVAVEYRRGLAGVCAAAAVAEKVAVEARKSADAGPLHDTSAGDADLSGVDATAVDKIMRWFNKHLAQLGMEPVSNLTTDLAGGMQLVALMHVGDPEVGRCRLTVSNPSRKRAWFQRLKQKCDEPLPNFAFNFYLCRYTEAVALDGPMQDGSDEDPRRAARYAIDKAEGVFGFPAGCVLPADITSSDSAANLALVVWMMTHHHGMGRAPPPGDVMADCDAAAAVAAAAVERPIEDEVGPSGEPTAAAAELVAAHDKACAAVRGFHAARDAGEVKFAGYTRDAMKFVLQVLIRKGSGAAAGAGAAAGRRESAASAVEDE